MTDYASAYVRQRQDPLIKRYGETPDEARMIDHARTRGGVDTDPFHGVVCIGDDSHGVSLPFGIHRAVGGFHDAPNPGDLLCAALAACLDSTLRIIAERLGIGLDSLEVRVSAHADVRGTLMVERTVPVGFQSVQCHVDIRPGKDSDRRALERLVAAAERCCVNLQTLSAGVAVETRIDEAAS